LVNISFISVLFLLAIVLSGLQFTASDINSFGIFKHVLQLNQFYQGVSQSCIFRFSAISLSMRSLRQQACIVIKLQSMNFILQNYPIRLQNILSQCSDWSFFLVQEHKLFSKSFMAENLNMHDWETPW
jgi:hypothetical protein